MKIISHRGYWKAVDEKNTEAAFRRSFSLGFGTETDVRDCCGELVISHDMPMGEEMRFEDFLKLHAEYEGKPTLALNIKSDGLQARVQELINRYALEDYFVFDMSIPDTLGYLKQGCNVFLRLSEYEGYSSLLDQAQGIWLDGFKSLSIDANRLERLLQADKSMCIVSPELHSRDPGEEWQVLKNLPESILRNEQMILCTDIPEEAQEYFSDAK